MKSIKNVYKIGAGPSSSHTMGPERACLQLKEYYQEIGIESVKCNLYGSLALTGKGHLTDYIIEHTLAPIPTVVEFHMTKALPAHENGMELISTLKNGEVMTWTIYSIGGGDIIVEELAKENTNGDIYPHNTMNEISAYCIEKGINFYEYIMEFEPEVKEYMVAVLAVMQQAIQSGLEKEGALPGKLQLQRRAKKLYEMDSNDPEMVLSAYATAVNEENASGGTIVTSPTCGACGVLPAVLRYNREEYNLSDDKLIEGLMVAALFGNLVKNNASVSGAEAGCQAEVGTATAMAAAAIAHLKGHDIQTIEAAAEIAFEHQLGLTCDPVMGYVQLPCIQRNAMGAVKARLAAKLAAADPSLEMVDFDTIVRVMYETGKDMASGYRETSTGGIAKYFKKKEELDV